jgi:hypothetical protein
MKNKYVYTPELYLDACFSHYERQKGGVIKLIESFSNSMHNRFRAHSSRIMEKWYREALQGYHKKIEFR